MAKQTQLRHLVNELDRAIRIHCDELSHRPGAASCAAASDAVDVAEKRIFSWFDALNQQLTVAERISNERLNRCAELHRQVEQMTGTGQPVQKFEPFDLKRAQAGDPIEVRVTSTSSYASGADKIDWIPARFVGVRSDGAIVYECDLSPYLLSSDESTLRMASKTQDIQMFANVYEQGDKVWGFLANENTDVRPMLPPGRRQLAADLPVTITVAK